MLPLGEVMQREEDGVRGIVVEEELGAGLVRRIAYYDRGERRIASTKEKWHPVEMPATVMRAEEKLAVAYAADAKLRAIRLHEPDRFWEKPDFSEEPHDPGLVMAILHYLGTTK